jgi:hypothetical protein
VNKEYLEELQERFDKEFSKLLAMPDTPSFVLELGPGEAFILLSQLQLALSHPDNLGHSSKIAKNIALLAQGYLEDISSSDVLREVIERGWGMPEDEENLIILTD